MGPAASPAQAVAFAGTVVNERVQVPEGATLAAMEDPEGNPLMLVQQ
ncbi:MAG: hypothetical protein J2P45_03605 [Candidatus Dormibacteraeota bacterium]|nr:hypothetical protein [Candidatus Dormibacteraeota bacterium]